jgi:hypothetical protein
MAIFTFCVRTIRASGKLRANMAITWFWPGISMAVKWLHLSIETVCFRERFSTHIAIFAINLDRHGWW